MASKLATNKAAITRASNLRIMSKKTPFCLRPRHTIQMVAQIVIESWRRHYNAVRPHASLGYRPPAPEVFVPALAAWPSARTQTAPTARSRWRQDRR